MKYYEKEINKRRIRDLQRNYQIRKLYIIGKPFARRYWKYKISFYGNLCNIVQYKERKFGNFGIKNHVTSAVIMSNLIGRNGI